MTFTIRTCEQKSVQCKESFRLLYYEADSDIANDQRPSWDDETYEFVDVIAGLVWTDDNPLQSNTVKRTVPVTKNGVYFAFLDEGACVVLRQVRVYNIRCLEHTVNFAHFPDTPVDAAESGLVPVPGACVENAVVDTQPVSQCNAIGHWVLPTGLCKCIPGFQPFNVTFCKGECLHLITSHEPSPPLPLKGCCFVFRLAVLLAFS